MVIDWFETGEDKWTTLTNGLASRLFTAVVRLLKFVFTAEDEIDCPAENWVGAVTA
jgi:hypothetical protein